jgi:hypothetical protein
MRQALQDYLRAEDDILYAGNDKSKKEEAEIVCEEKWRRFESLLVDAASRKA